MKESIKEIEVHLRVMQSDDDPRLHQWKNDDRKGVERLLHSFYKRLQKKQLMHEHFVEMSSFEREARENGYHFIAGIDEVGRGPLAGPVVAAAVILPEGFYLPGLDDSKKLNKSAKARFIDVITQQAISNGIGYANAKEIDEVNIYQATKMAMQRALNALEVTPDMLLIDAMTLDVETSQQSIIKGDARSVSIAAASVVAKVTRDRYMAELANTYPSYKFERNAGYGTKEHLDGLHTDGPCKEHRFSFEPVRVLTK